jgi:hypothetical protein
VTVLIVIQRLKWTNSRLILLISWHRPHAKITACCIPSIVERMHCLQMACYCWVEFILRTAVSRPVRLSIGFPFGPMTRFYPYPFFSDNCFGCSSCRAPSLTRGQVCNLQCNRWLVRSLRTNNHTLPSHLRLCSLFVASYNSQGLRWRYSNPLPHESATVAYLPNCCHVASFVITAQQQAYMAQY